MIISKRGWFASVRLAIQRRRGAV